MKKIITSLSALSLAGLLCVSANASTINATELMLSGIDIVKIKAVMPDYPNSAISQKVQGNVVLSYDLNKQGQAINIQVVSYEGSKRFIRPSIMALKATQFEPVVTDNKATAVIGLKKQYDFLIKDEQDNKSLPGLTAFNI